ncbi:MAG: glycosyl hydrolase family 18 protein [Actinomycetota bacterium]
MTRVILTSLAVVAGLLLVGGCSAPRAAPSPNPTATAGAPTIPTELYVRADTGVPTSLDRDAKVVATIGIDGVALSGAGDAVSKLPANAAELVAAAHARGLTAELLVSNYDAAKGEFSRAIATAMLTSAERRGAVAAGLVAQVAAAGFDGVQIDFQSLTSDEAANLAAFTLQLRDLLGAPKSLTLAVTAESSAVRYLEAGYDLAMVTPLISRVVLMAYDQHGTARSKPGPVGGISRATTAIDALLAAGVPSARIDLGVAGYGDSWPGNGSDAKRLSVAESRTLAGDLARWDSEEAEWTATLPDDTVVWWSDARSLSARRTLALSRNLHGLAVWELSLTDPL